MPSVTVYRRLVDVFYAQADAAKEQGDAAAEAGDADAALDAYGRGLDALRNCYSPAVSSKANTEDDDFASRAAAILSRRGAAFERSGDSGQALRDAAAALEISAGRLSSAEVVFKTALVQALQSAGGEAEADDAALHAKLREHVGTGRLLNRAAPLVLAGIDRWLAASIEAIASEGAAACLPAEASHADADRYFDGLGEDERKEIEDRYSPETCREDGGQGSISSAEECLELMLAWEKVLSRDEFQKALLDVWDRPGLSYPARLGVLKELVAASLSSVLEPLGYASGAPGLSRCVKQMQQFWSYNKACAQKALDLEELAEVSLADLE